MPSETFEQLLDRAASCLESSRAIGISGAATTPPRAEAKQAILRAMGVAAGNAEELEQVAGGAGAARMGAAGCRPRWWPARPAGRTAAERAGGIGWASARASPCGARTARRREFELNLCGPAADRLGGNGRAARGCASRRGCRCAAAGLSRDHGEGRGPARCHPLHRDARARLDATRTWAAADARPGSPSASTACARSATGAAAISAICWSVVDWVADELEASFVGAQSAARHPQPPAVQHQPLPAELHLLPEFPLSGCGGHGGFRAVPARAGAAANRRRCSARSRSCARRRSWNTSGWRRSSCAS